MPKAEYGSDVAVSAEQFYKAVTAYADYPKMLDGFKKVVVEDQGAGKKKVSYSFSIMFKTVEYVLSVTEVPAENRLSWTLLSSDVFKVNSGGWEIKATGAKSANVKYWLEAEFKVPVPEMILNQLVKGSMPLMVKQFEKAALKRG